VLEDKYEVTDQDVESEIDRIKDQLGEQFDMWLMQEGIKDEVALEKIIRISLLQEAAITEGIEIDEDDIKAQYDREITEIEAKHILVEDEETANEIKEKLDDGEDFAKLAKEYSEDEASAENGGEVGYFGVGEMVPEFEEAAFELEIDTISEPVQSSYGFHIIQVTDKREKEDSESYDDMKDMIERQLISEKVDPEEAQKTLNDILDDAKIDIKVKDLEDIFNEEEVVG
ncbi:MAG TPA: peptidylprolyl isomerase, partial [Bacillota bacterium]|nr:peptidylprolyl isomerase [Bacillota bacterium]